MIFSAILVGIAVLDLNASTFSLGHAMNKAKGPSLYMLNINAAVSIFKQIAVYRLTFFSRASVM